MGIDPRNELVSSDRLEQCMRVMVRASMLKGMQEMRSALVDAGVVLDPPKLIPKGMMARDHVEPCDCCGDPIGKHRLYVNGALLCDLCCFQARLRRGFWGGA